MIRIELIGRLTKDPETRTVVSNGNEVPVTTFTVAASHGFGDRKHTEFVRVSAWRNNADICAKYLRKGSKIYMSGTPAINAYVGRDGQAAGNLEIQLDEIEFLSAKPADTVETPLDSDDDDLEELL